jgi:hypothetical protein
MTWRTVQFFISLSTGVSEVQINDEGKMRCSCNGFSLRSKCKHTVQVEPLVEKSIKRSASKSELDESKSPDKFRELVLRYGQVKVG